MIVLILMWICLQLHSCFKANLEVNGVKHF